MEEKKEILNYMNIFRAIAIIIIVMWHSFLGCKNPVFSAVLTEVLREGTILFVFISGFLFQHLSYKYEYKTFLKKKFFNIVLPYIATSSVGILICMFCHIGPFFDMNKFVQIPVYLATGYWHNPPTWYIPMTIVFFLFADILLRLDHRKKLYCFLPLLLLIVIFTKKYDASAITHHLTHLEYYFRTIQTLLFRIIHYFPVYILGMFFSANKHYIKLLYQKRAMLLACMLVCAFADVYFNIQNASISFIFLTLLALGMLEHYDFKIRSAPVFNQCMNFISQYSFGIFFIHWYMLMLYCYIAQNVFHHNIKIFLNFTIHDFNSFCNFFVICFSKFLFSFFASILICFVIRKLLLKLGVTKTRYFIGV